MISEAEHEDYELERCSLSPRSLRLKRLLYFELRVSKLETNTDIREPENIDINMVETDETTEIVTENPKVFKKTKVRCLAQTRARKRCMNMCYDDYCHKHKVSRKDNIDTV